MAFLDQVSPAEAARARVRADLDLIDAAQARLRAADTDVVGNAFRIEIAERLETQHRVNRGLSYRMFGEIADRSTDPMILRCRPRSKCVTCPNRVIRAQAVSDRSEA
jgi:hypothetical protein